MLKVLNMRKNKIIKIKGDFILVDCFMIGKILYNHESTQKLVRENLVVKF